MLLIRSEKIETHDGRYQEYHGLAFFDAPPEEYLGKLQEAYLLTDIPQPVKSFGGTDLIDMDTLQPESFTDSLMQYMTLFGFALEHLLVNEVSLTHTIKDKYHAFNIMFRGKQVYVTQDTLDTIRDAVDTKYDELENKVAWGLVSSFMVKDIAGSEQLAEAFIREYAESNEEYTVLESPRGVTLFSVAPPVRRFKTENLLFGDEFTKFIIVNKQAGLYPRSVPALTAQRYGLVKIASGNYVGHVGTIKKHRVFRDASDTLQILGLLVENSLSSYVSVAKSRGGKFSITFTSHDQVKLLQAAQIIMGKYNHIQTRVSSSVIPENVSQNILDGAHTIFFDDSQGEYFLISPRNENIR
jgi:hypothetical protein